MPRVTNCAAAKQRYPRRILPEPGRRQSVFDSGDMSIILNILQSRHAVELRPDHFCGLYQAIGIDGLKLDLHSFTSWRANAFSCFHENAGICSGALGISARMSSAASGSSLWVNLDGPDNIFGQILTAAFISPTKV